jgi:LysM repeat protein
VTAGDTLSKIARKFGVTVAQILAANKNIKNPNKIAIGDVIIIPIAKPSVISDGGASSSP